MHTQKIATCCYCGARTILQLTARSGHELACASCGAPIHEMKPLRTDRGKKADHDDRAGYRKKKGFHDKHHAYADKNRKKRKRSTLWRVLEEVVDVVEDIID